MKYIIILIVYISLMVLRGNGFSHFETINEEQYSTDEGFEHHKCWGKDWDGYNTEFALSSFNTYYPTPKGIVPASFYEGGVIDVSFKKKMMYVHFGVVAKKDDGSSLVFAGRLYTYGDNSTQYVIMNGSSTCYAMKLQYPFPDKLPKIKKVGTTQLGDIDVDVIILKNNNMTGYNWTRQCTLMKKDSCTPLSSNIGNADRSELGFSLMNFYRYEHKPNLTKIQLPQECYGVTPSDDQVFAPFDFSDDEPFVTNDEEGDTQVYNEEEVDQLENENFVGIHKNLEAANYAHHNRRHHRRGPHGHHPPPPPPPPHHHHRRGPHGHHPHHPHHITKDGEFIYYPHVADLVLIH